MPSPTPNAGNDLTQAIQTAEILHGFIQSTVPISFVVDNEAKPLIAALFHLVEEHHAAILYLLRTGNFDGSAFALARPLVDAFYRAHWLATCASAESVVRLKAGENVYPPLRNMAEAVEKELPTEGIYSSVVPFINTLHGLTHGGMEQLSRRYDFEGSLAANYSDGEKIHLVDALTAYFVLLSVTWCQLASGIPGDGQASARSILDKYVALYGSGA